MTTRGDGDRFPPPVVRPTHEDPLVRAGSESIGGPAGEHSSGHPWWTPVRVVLALTCVGFLLAMVQKTPCVAEDWPGGNYRYAALCYSDVPYLYVPRGLADLSVPRLTLLSPEFRQIPEGLLSIRRPLHLLLLPDDLPDPLHPLRRFTDTAKFLRLEELMARIG